MHERRPDEQDVHKHRRQRQRTIERVAAILATESPEQAQEHRRPKDIQVQMQRTNRLTAAQLDELLAMLPLGRNLTVHGNALACIRVGLQHRMIPPEQFDRIRAALAPLAALPADGKPNVFRRQTAAEILAHLGHPPGSVTPTHTPLPPSRSD